MISRGSIIAGCGAAMSARSLVQVATYPFTGSEIGIKDVWY